MALHLWNTAPLIQAKADADKCACVNWKCCWSFINIWRLLESTGDVPVLVHFWGSRIGTRCLFELPALSPVLGERPLDRVPFLYWLKVSFLSFQLWHRVSFLSFQNCAGCLFVLSALASDFFKFIF